VLVDRRVPQKTAPKAGFLYGSLNAPPQIYSPSASYWAWPE
jgi:hypothetical protein